MAIITFWSNNPKQIGQTLSTAAVATYLGMTHNNKILLLETDYNNKMLESAFGSQIKNKSVLQVLGKSTSTVGVDSGIEGLTKMSYSNRLTPELIPNYTKVVYRNHRLEVIYGPTDEGNQDEETDYNKILSRYKDIIIAANRFYDFVIVDLNKGFDTVQTKEILGMSDIIVVNIEQRWRSLNDFIELREKEPMLKGNNVILLVNRYDKYSKYTLKNISRTLGEKKQIHAIPYNTLFFEACEEGTLADFMLKVRNVDDQDRNAIFVNEVKSMSDKIIYKLQELQMRI